MKRLQEAYDNKYPLGHQSFDVFYRSTSVHSLSSFLHLLKHNLVYSPEERMNAYDICAHKFFKRLSSKHILLPSGKALPKSLFCFTEEELLYMSNEAMLKLVKSVYSVYNFLVFKRHLLISIDLYSSLFMINMTTKQEERSMKTNSKRFCVPVNAFNESISTTP